MAWKTNGGTSGSDPTYLEPRVSAVEVKTNNMAKVPNRQTWVATEGQTDFTISNGSISNVNLLDVYVGGVPQDEIILVNSTTFRFSESLSVGMKVYAEWFEVEIPIGQTHKSTHEKNGADEIDITKLKNYDVITSQLAEISTQVKDNNLQNAIDQTPVNGVLRLKQGEVYNISSPLTVSKFLTIEGNGATLKAVTSMSQLILISQPGSSDTSGGFITNLIVDCNNLAQTGINVSSSAKFNHSNVHVLNATLKGIWAQNNHEGSYNNIRLTNCEVGIVADGSDQHFTDIFMRYCHVAIQNNAYNIYTRVHAWIKDTFSGSKFAEISSMGVFNECYPDTYHYGYYIKAWVAVSINGGHLFWNQEYWTGTAVTGLTPHFLYYTDMRYSASTKVSNVYGSSSVLYNVSNSLTPYDFQGTVSDSNLLFGYMNLYSGKRSQATLSGGITANLNKIVVKNNRVLMELKVQPSTPLSGTITVATIPTALVPENEKIFAVAYGEAYGYDGSVYGYISPSGSVKIGAATPHSAVKWFNINVEYDIAFDNHQ